MFRILLLSFFMLLTISALGEDGTTNFGNAKDIGWGYGIEEGHEAWDLGVVYLERSPRYPNQMRSKGSSNRPKPGDS